MFENQNLHVKFEKIEFSYNSCFDSFNITYERRVELKNRDVLFVPQYL